ncbi:hypothetical protein I6A84_18515 [Frankia sp. CNm7]|uniref:Alpha/beta hydrolase domain-containing protein n=1 Tax=Frankia nepalensis TaxID=1836974 RepID=A0A937RLW8_9ACTN|nr:alpha/beta hydrolase domain-containing protein [Frankia nepalensis]MBL7499274.1 hypothetical protein [Frankia nepalensis]MBL7513503.1 hypothetical protein [Frankia nepalensis]MBL7520031.1 hypothetical protein [Frankia nepalensis]MBL7628778.1 hypothetical protein [Frankia nepalensis]
MKLPGSKPGVLPGLPGAGGARPRRAPRWRRRTVAAIACAVVLPLTACVGPGMPGGPGGPGGGPTPAPTPVPGPTADLSQELTGGGGPFIGTAIPVDLPAAGYVQHEYAAAGTATSYKAVGGLSGDGRWRFEPDGTAPYRTRVLVRQPADAERFSGTVIVEWLNVSGGVDADPEWATLHEEIIRAGHIWVGVSAQRLGVLGGQVLVTVPAPGSELAGKGLKAIDPARYGSLDHPGDGFAYDILTQVARGVRGGAGIGGLAPRKLIASGQSQSAFAMTTYYNGVQPLTGAFDGFYVLSRGAAGLPLVGPGQNADLTGALLGGTTTTFRTDQRAPVMDVQAESDLTSILGSAKARQPDSDRFRLWEIAGTAHADKHLLGANAANIDCGVPINDGPMHVVAKAALRGLTTWLDTGQPPASAARVTVNEGLFPSVRRDADGIALGGVRTPPVDVPAVALSGEPGPALSAICLLIGSTKPLPAARLAQLYPSRADYEQRYTAGTAAAITAGFVLAEDRAALLGYARPELVAG